MEIVSPVLPKCKPENEDMSRDKEYLRLQKIKKGRK
jgi:hypothetical protein